MLRLGVNGYLKATTFAQMIGKAIDTKQVKQLADIQAKSFDDLERRLTVH